MMYKHVTDTG